MPWRARDVRPPVLRRRASRPQLKRDPLGGSQTPMRFRHLVGPLLLIVVIGCQPEIRFFKVRPKIVRLPTGDSVLFVATGPIFDPNGDTGLMYEYHPYIPLEDTTRLRPQVLELWDAVRPKAESVRAPFVVLRATTRFTELPVPQPAIIKNYGFVLEKRTDGLWYFLYDSVPVRSQ